MNGARVRISKKGVFPFYRQENLYRTHFPLFQWAFLPRKISFKVNIFEERVMLPVISRFWGEHVSLNTVICATFGF